MDPQTSMAVSLALIAAHLTGGKLPSLPSPPPRPEPEWSKPVEIKKGGIYKGNWRSDDPNVPAVRILTNEPVTLEGNTASAGHHVACPWQWVNLTVRNVRARGLNPNKPGLWQGRFIVAEGVESLIAHNNDLDGTSGIYINGWRRGKESKETIKILRNRAQNISGRHSNGSGGYLDAKFLAQFAQLNHLNGVPGMEIAWNDIENEPGISGVEDNINVSDSGGTADSWLDIHHNRVNGAYGTPPSAVYSGSGIMFEDGQYRRAHHNTLIETSNSGVGVSDGNYTDVFANIVLGLGVLPDGTLLDGDPDAGAYFRDYTPQTPRDPKTVRYWDNLVGWAHPRPNNARGVLKIEPRPLAATDLGGNEFLTFDQITPEVLAAALQRWDMERIMRGLNVGAA